MNTVSFWTSPFCSGCRLGVYRRGLSHYAGLVARKRRKVKGLLGLVILFEVVSRSFARPKPFPCFVWVL